MRIHSFDGRSSHRNSNMISEENTEGDNTMEKSIEELRKNIEKRKSMSSHNRKNTASPSLKIKQ